MATLASATLKLWIYDGLINSYTGTPQYTITKSKILGETTILFEISELIKDYVQVSFTGNYDTAKLSSWASFEITNTFDDTPNPTTTVTKGTRLVTHGYGYFEDEINPQLTTPLQQSNTCIFWKKGEKVRIPLYKENQLYSAEFFEGSTSSSTQTFGKTVVNLTADTTDYTADTTLIRADANQIMSGNSKNITSGINADTGTDKVIITTDDNKTITLSITYVEECKNTPYKVTFLNKFGSLQDIWFFGRRRESANVTREEYKINTVEATATTKSYPTYSPTNRVHNLESDKSLVLNTGFICEEYNEVVQQMMQSEYVWIHENNRVYPVTPSDNNIEYKNERYDKLLNFTVRFDYAFSELNSVR